MENWNRQIKTARYMLLGTVIITVVNLAFLLSNSDQYVYYSSALSYYLVWLGKLFDNSNYLGPVNGVYTSTGLVMGGVVLAGYLLVWWLARDQRKWLQVGMWLIVADLAVLAVLAWKLFEEPMDCFWEVGLHLVVIWEMAQGIKAHKSRQEYLAQQAEEAARQDCLL